MNPYNAMELEKLLNEKAKLMKGYVSDKTTEVIFFLLEKTIKAATLISEKINPYRGFKGVEEGSLITFSKTETYLSYCCWVEEREMFSNKHIGYYALKTGVEKTGLVIQKETIKIEESEVEEERDKDVIFKERGYTELLVAVDRTVFILKDGEWFSGLRIKKY